MSAKRKPTHPGQFLREEFLEPNEITQEAFANALKINRVTVSKILNTHQRITPDVALRLSKCLDTTPEVWLNMQIKVDLWEEQHNLRHRKLRGLLKPLIIIQAI